MNVNRARTDSRACRALRDLIETLSRSSRIRHLGVMNKALLGMIVWSMTLGLLACSSKDSLLDGRDGGPGVGGSGTGGTAAKTGTGGSGTLSGTGGATTTKTTLAATGGTTTVATGGTPLATGGSTGGRTGAGGGGGIGGGSGGSTVADAGADTAKDAVQVDALDAPVECAPGYPVGSTRPAGDGCNTCTCLSTGAFVCTASPCVAQDASAACPSNYRWCPGCTPGTGSCELYCPASPCFIGDGGAETGDATLACSGVATQADCEARSDCHPVFQDLGVCGCAGVGCCIRFNRCASGAKAICTVPATFGCTVQTPSCEGDFVISYSGSCYEGCVKTSECGS